MSEEWNKESVLALSTAFQTCRILLSAAQLDLFTRLGGDPKTVQEICEQTGWDERSLRILMDALVAQGLLEKTQDSRYRADEQILQLLGKHGPESVLPLVLHRSHMWETWSKLTEIVKTGTNPNPMGMSSRSSQEVEDFISAMHVVGLRMADEIAASVDLRPFKSMLDVGGASGTYIMAFLRRAPHLMATLFDYPSVAEMGRKKLSEGGVSERVRIVPGDYKVDELPPGHDLVLLSAVIHSNNRETNRLLFGKAFRALDPAGMILIRDHVMEPSRTFPRDGAVFAVNMLCATSGGNTYTFDEIREDLGGVGFTGIRMLRQGENMDQLLVADKPR
ncbi:MAG: hypothetical protein HY912_10340 [Desulfomonile tiedjei]|uniref:O-methyltransferase n=1 Tax=Desulfomonile tiedjei TaxID=2358 RepID=A0A9D6V4K4_9BACT|nr:hypothetical protein [Desulfomonile tiedjei]